jgi:hypothetical protein
MRKKFFVVTSPTLPDGVKNTPGTPSAKNKPRDYRYMFLKIK